MPRVAQPLTGKTVVLGVTGSIAAFKAPHIVTGLKALGARVLVVMTENATRFVTPLTFETLSGSEVIVTMWSEKKAGVETVEDALAGDDHLEHVHLAEAADLAIVAPATANIVGKMANGLADDFLSTELLAMTCPVIVAPAMNVRMMESDAVVRNLDTLRRRGVTVVESETGRLASGVVGKGRLADPDRIIDVALGLLLPKQDLAGRRVVVTAGPTEEPIDPVRHVGNRSTGKMGFAIAERALRRGANVVLIAGPTALEPPAAVRLVQVRTTEEMRDAVMAELPELDLLVMAAAPADYRPAEVARHKIKKGAERLVLGLIRTPDILSEVSAARRAGQGVVGFALETEDEIRNGKKKLEEKRLDLIVVNNPNTKGAGFAVDTNIAVILGRSGREDAPGAVSKAELADVVLSRAVEELGWGDEGAAEGLERGDDGR
jgi:phosphopantothenoylcysteine decarboxylase/phosphopantothenate--cysteine ligase